MIKNSNSKDIEHPNFPSAEITGKYIGYVKIETDSKGIEHFNFTPVAEIIENEDNNSEIRILSMDDRKKLLPKSVAYNLELGYPYNDTDVKQFMAETFPNDILIMLDLNSAVLHYCPKKEKDSAGNYVLVKDENENFVFYPVAYRFLNTHQRKEKFQQLFKTDYRHHFVCIIPLVDKDSFFNNKIVTIPSTNTNISVGEKVVVELDNMWAGPYEVNQDSDNSFFIKPEIEKRNYIISGYKKDNNRTLEIQNIRYLLPSTTTEQHIDVMDSKILLNYFKESLEDSVVEDGKISIDDFSLLLEQYENSKLLGNDIPQAIKEQRIEKLKQITYTTKESDHILTYWLEQTPNLVDKLLNSSPVIKQVNQYAEAEKNRLQDELRELEEATNKRFDELAKLDSEIETRSKTKDNLDEQIRQQNNQLNEATANYERTKKEWEQAIQKVTDEFNTALESPEKMMAKTAIDGYRASKVLQAAAEWEKTDSQGKYDKLIQSTNEVADEIAKKIEQKNAEHLTPEGLCNHLCNTVQKVRNYKRNEILNIAICITQGFLTVFSGEPGCGKTSICNIFGDVLGLNKIGAEIQTNCGGTDTKPKGRYISVSVERGWTSKRDFVGYYNPLSKSFNTNNQAVYDALCLLDKEKETNQSNFPYLILLDEANLSPMEYYWSDFMNICDDLNEQSQVNFGDEYTFSIPETLHFVATINNDDTTERLSPRLIDRAWIVSLPEYDAMSEQKSSADFKENIQIIPWSSLRNAFFVEDEENDFIPVERNFFADDTKNKEISTDQLTKVKTAYKDILDQLKKLGITVNARTNQAIRKYWAVASRCFADDTFKNKAYKEKNNEDTKVDKTIVALDYAVMQKLLPKISGNGPDFKGALEKLRDTCSSYGLKESTKIIKGILSGGNYDYYNFFHRGVYQEDGE